VARKITLTVAQIQSLALKTMGHRPDLDVSIVAPYEDSMEIEFELLHVRVGINDDGHWRVWAEHGDEALSLSNGEMPRFYEWRESR
jgi:hypothetical protein